MPHPCAPRSVAAAAVATVAAASLAFQPLPAAADPGGRPVSELLRELQVMYERTEAASDAYNTTAAKLKRQRARADKAGRALTSVRSALAESRREAGRLARQQYRRGDIGLPPLVQVLLTRDARDAADNLRLLTRAAGRQATTVHRLVAGERRQRQLTAAARKALAGQQRLADRKEKQRATARSRLHRVERTLASLSGAELTRLRGLESAQQTGTQRTLMSAHGMDKSATVRRKPSRPGAQAVRFALRQLGKPYRFGADGPTAYDCSGLTSTAWKQAGRSIPRTSQAQWKTLRRVPMNRLRPGDLVVYYKSASHVALYAGRGKVVHAPRPGARVKVSPVGAIPSVRGAVRPDAGARPLPHYRLPKLLR
ncbi:cell wall-associated NlpC family hydrolase [Streptomyces sp. Amel2xB2]|uniref:C40 family peptidase n=1 Tax=Streptomyces sp. Amel2xB2 TaxID=1305829 RepID=UPI000DBF69BA|nr:C40 family peptidase [Streptomyces sp. Amel2xB2]RAJ71367.1 cell wall-associated NlpC family hydrolase [Streptomyces sp. Amel2xB2]